MLTKLRHHSVMILTGGALALAVGFSGCAATADGRLTQAQGTGAGAGIGAIAGGIIAAATGNDPWKGAALGGAIGAGAGFVFGSHVANQKAKYASTEDWLDACIASAQKRNGEAYAFNQKLRSQVSSLESRVRAAKSAGNKGELRKLRGEIASLSKAAQGQVNRSEQEIKAQGMAIENAGTGQSSRVSQIRANTTKINSNANTTKSYIERLASLRNQTDV